MPIIVVVGYQKDEIKETINRRHHNAINFVVQDEQCGTGHALMCTHATWEREHVLIMNGDVPLVTTQIIESLYFILFEEPRKSSSAARKRGCSPRTIMVTRAAVATSARVSRQKKR